MPAMRWDAVSWGVAGFGKGDVKCWEFDVKSVNRVSYRGFKLHLRPLLV